LRLGTKPKPPNLPSPPGDPPGGAKIKVAPASNGQKISHSDKPKVYATFSEKDLDDKQLLNQFCLRYCLELQTGHVEVGLGFHSGIPGIQTTGTQTTNPNH